MTVAICQIGTASGIAFALCGKRASQPETQLLRRQIPSEASDHLKRRREGYSSKQPNVHVNDKSKKKSTKERDNLTVNDLQDCQRVCKRDVLHNNLQLSAAPNTSV